MAWLLGRAWPPVEAALRALWPRAGLGAAYSLDSSVQELVWIGGPLLLAVLLATGKLQLPLLACAAATISGTVLYTLGLPASRDRDAAARAPSPLRRARLRVPLVPAACYGFAAGILNLALVAFAAAHGGTSWAGVLAAVWGTGSLAGGLAYGSRDWRSRVEDQAMACAAFFASC